MGKSIKNLKCRIALSNAFMNLNKCAKVNDKYWMTRYYEEIIGMITIMFYSNQITNKQYKLIGDIARSISIFGYYKKAA